MLRSDTFQYIYYNLLLRESKPPLRPLQSQPGNPNRRIHRKVLNPDLSRLHLLLPPEFHTDEVLHRNHRGYLREVVYSGSNFGEINDWGPFTADGKVDWTLVDALGSVMSGSRSVRANHSGKRPRRPVHGRRIVETCRDATVVRDRAHAILGMAQSPTSCSPRTSRSLGLGRGQWVVVRLVCFSRVSRPSTTLTTATPTGSRSTSLA